MSAIKEQYALIKQEERINHQIDIFIEKKRRNLTKIDNHRNKENPFSKAEQGVKKNPEAGPNGRLKVADPESLHGTYHIEPENFVTMISPPAADKLPKTIRGGSFPRISDEAFSEQSDIFKQI